MQDLAEKYVAAVPGSAESQILGAELDRFQDLIDNGTECLAECRRQRVAEYLDLRDHLEDHQEGTAARQLAQSNISQYKAEERALHTSLYTPLRPETADTCADDSKIEDICDKAQSDAKKGYATLKKLGATPAFLAKVLRMPGLLAAATTTKDARDILSMDSDELADWADDCEFSECEDLESDSESNFEDSECDNNNTDSDLGYSDNDPDSDPDFEDNGDNGGVQLQMRLEAAVDWTTLVTTSVNNKVEKVEKVEMKKWTRQEVELVVSVLVDKHGPTWWTAPSYIGVYELIEEKLKNLGFTRNKAAIAGKVHALAQKLKVVK